VSKYPEHQDSLWSLTVPPTIWAVHFLVCYVSAALWCSKAGEAAASIGGIRVVIAVVTVVALVGIAISGVGGYRRHGGGFETTGHDFDSREGRHRFLGFSAMLLAGLSAVATVFTAMPAIFIETCR
jgi:amino acid permease